MEGAKEGMQVSREPMRPFLALLIALGVCFAVSAIGGAITRPNLDWYGTLVKPGFAPPNAAFPIVWTILYAMMAVAAWLVWRSARQRAGQESRAHLVRRPARRSSVLWSSPSSGCIARPIGFGVIMALHRRHRHHHRVLRQGKPTRRHCLLIPYVLWVAFATGLNFAIWVLNSGFDFTQTQ